MTMNSNKIWRGWATNFGNGDGVIPFFSHTPSLPESYETVLLSKADFDALCGKNERLKSAMDKYSENETLHTIEALLADLNFVCAEVHRCDDLLTSDKYNWGDVAVMYFEERPTRVMDIMERWKEQQL